MTANLSNSLFDYLDRLVEKYDNTYHCFSGKKHVEICYSSLSEENRQTDNKGDISALVIK